MSARIANPFLHAASSFKSAIALERSFSESTIEPVILDLVRLRASQINGCAYCIHMHVTDLKKLGEEGMRLHMLDGWRESSLYTPRERAALAWTDALTLLTETHAPDADYELLKSQFTEEEQVVLTLAIGTINMWNRMNVGFRSLHPSGEIHRKSS
ncbi:carboxymuconolactone decarboxylase family protein [Tardiphaga alba]|uniref:Carboxymuconolactone decarboxylase family protein n=1 Tax=Tardiphaga alba TaxID=340268 RepID=A0ABX8AES0_9BRAD|nr:carboxymuconolactone decarboxylase family protein [Tardiphaga alba]QUS42032.1 carboxymuconolactone decarboxylase family protein [Tardiphaga alba]